MPFDKKAYYRSPEWKEYFRKYYQSHKERMDEDKKRNRLENPERERKTNRGRQEKWRNRHPERELAHQISHRFPIGKFCELCPEDDVRTENLERHHPDYDYPEIFITVCKECHIYVNRHKF